MIKTKIDQSIKFFSDTGTLTSYGAAQLTGIYEFLGKGRSQTSIAAGNIELPENGSIDVGGELKFKNVIIPKTGTDGYILTVKTPQELEFVDKATIPGYKSVGEIAFYPNTGTHPDGWLFMDGSTIGSTYSGASALADSSAFPLFKHLWGNYSDTLCPMSGGRGASPEEDFAAAKTIGLPYFGGYALGITGIGSGFSTRVPLDKVGEETHVVSIAEYPNHRHLTVSGGTVVPITVDTSTSNLQSKLGSTLYTTGSSGSGAAHNNMQPSAWFAGIIRI